VIGYPSALGRVRLGEDDAQLCRDLDLPYPAAIHAGALYYRWLLTYQPIDENIIDGLIGMFMVARVRSGASRSEEQSPLRSQEVGPILG